MLIDLDNLEQQWVGLLKLSFAGLDYWSLSKEWKMKVFKEVAKMMMDDIRYLQLQEQNENNADEDYTYSI